jgi:hypothetical protein
VTKLEKTANIAVILAALVLIGFNLYDRFLAPRIRTATFAQKTIGKVLPLSASSAVGTTATIVLFVSKGCHFCSESMPFYRRLAALMPPGSHELSLLGAVPAERDGRKDAEAYFAQNGVVVNGIEQIPFQRIGLYATPTLALLDGSRRVVAVWTGRITGAQEEAVVRKLNTLCANCTSR